MNANNELATVIEKYTVLVQCNVDYSEREALFTLINLKEPVCLRVGIILSLLYMKRRKFI